MFDPTLGGVVRRLLAPETLGPLVGALAVVMPFFGLICGVLLQERLGSVRAAALVLSVLMVFYGVVWPWL